MQSIHRSILVPHGQAILEDRVIYLGNLRSGLRRLEVEQVVRQEGFHGCIFYWPDVQPDDAREYPGWCHVEFQNSQAATSARGYLSTHRVTGGKLKTGPIIKLNKLGGSTQNVGGQSAGSQGAPASSHLRANTASKPLHGPPSFLMSKTSGHLASGCQIWELPPQKDVEEGESDSQEAAPVEIVIYMDVPATVTAYIFEKEIRLVEGTTVVEVRKRSRVETHAATEIRLVEGATVVEVKKRALVATDTTTGIPKNLFGRY